MINPKMKYMATLVCLGIIVLGAQPVSSTPIDVMTPAQIVDPFEEMLTGVYSATEWWNQSSDDWQYSEYQGSYEYYHYVEDTEGNVYYVQEQNEYDIEDEWEFSNLLVVIILDPDASVMAWLANHLNNNPPGTEANTTYPYPEENYTYSEPVDYSYTDPATGETYYDLWTIFWNPPVEAMTGDEAFVYSSFYFSYYYSDYYFETNYTWYDESWNEVDPNEVIPILSEEYRWASWMNESWLYDEEWSYYGFGYDISEMTRIDDQVQWMNHYFSGMSAFDDWNSNGIMDMVYQEIEYDFDEDGIIDWTTYAIDTNNSERMFDFYSEEAVLGEVNLPSINDDGQIEWSAEVTNVKGSFWEYTPWEVFGATDALYVDEEYVEPDSIPAEVESLEMVYRFEVTDEAAVIKIDQLIGDFTDPETGNAIPELEGLGLTMNYWSSFSSYGIIPETPDGVVDYSTIYDATLAPGGNLDFMQQNTSDFMSISFGGTYVWGFDGDTYDVGTMILPDYYYYCYPCLEGTLDSASVSSQDMSWSYSTFYYSSCYSNWDGYEIIHDPIYAIYPEIAPGQVSEVMTGIVSASLIIGLVGIAAIVTACIQINKFRKMQ